MSEKSKNIVFEDEVKRRIQLIKQKFGHVNIDVEYDDTYYLKIENIKEGDVIFLTKNDMQIIKKIYAPELMDDAKNLLNKHPILLPTSTFNRVRLDSSKYTNVDLNRKELFYKIQSTKLTRCLLQDVINFLILHSIGTYDLELSSGIFVLTPYADSHKDLGLNYESITEKLVKTQTSSYYTELKGKYESTSEFQQRELEAAMSFSKEINGKDRKINGKRVY